MDRPLHELHWLSCATKRCCTQRTVFPTSAEIWRIASQLDVPPESFLRAVPTQHAHEPSFLLEPNGRSMQAALLRRALGGNTAACVFLMQLGAHNRCGLGPLRPIACQIFPASADSAPPHLAKADVCQCRQWSLSDLDRPRIAAQLDQLAVERQRYQQHVAAWNERIQTDNRTATFAEFCAFLLTEQQASAQ
jgi:Fe-S-cluster containining protein